MKPSDIVSAIVVFFNDLIGAVVPGLILLVGLHWLGATPDSVQKSELLRQAPFDWLLPLAFAYVAGHWLLGLNRLLERLIGGPLRGLNSLLTKGKWITLGFVDQLSKGEAYKLFKEDIKVRHRELVAGAGVETFSAMGFHDVRSVAMTLSEEAGELARRFMFISLLCYGTAMAVLVVALYALVFRAPLLDLSSATVAVVSVISFFVFYSRGLAFERRALNVPFSVALAVLLTDKKRDESEE